MSAGAGAIRSRRRGGGGLSSRRPEQAPAEPVVAEPVVAEPGAARRDCAPIRSVRRAAVRPV